VSEFIHIYNSSDDSYTPVGPIPDGLCSRCKQPLGQSTQIDLVVQEKSLYPGAVSHVTGTGVLVANNRLLERLPDEVFSYLSIGDLFSQNGSQLMGVSTLNSSSRVVVRGSQNVGYRRCECCDKVLYYASGKQFLCPRPSVNFRLHMSDLAGFVVERSLYESCSFSSFKMRAFHEEICLKGVKRRI